MSAGTWNIVIEKGATFSSTLTITDSAGTAVNLTGYTFAGKVRRVYSDHAAVGTFSFALATQSGATLGQVVMSMAAADTAAIPEDVTKSTANLPSTYRYDVTMTYPSGAVDRLLQGTAEIRPGVVR